MENMELWAEANRRGLLSQEERDLLAEASRRGLLPGGATPETWGDYAKGVGRSVAQGVGFGFGDEAIAATRSAVGGEDYAAALESERQALDQFRAAHPYVGYGAEIASAAVVPVGAAANALRGGATLGRVALTGAKTGAAQGAIHGFGAGEGGVAPRVGSAATEAAIGSAVGAALPTAVAGAGRIAGRVGEAVGSFANPREAAVRDIAEAMRVSGLSAEDVAAQMGGDFNTIDAAKQAAMAQGRPVASLPVTNLARNAAGFGGEAEALAAENIMGRQLAQPDRLRGQLADAVGGRNTADEVAALEATVQRQAGDAYKAAFANEKPFDLSGPLGDFVQKHQAVMNTNSPLGATVRGALKAFVERDIPDIGAVPISRLDQFQAARNGLDDMISGSLDQFGKNTKATRYLTELRRDVNATVRQANPDFAAADDIFAETARGKSALHLGQIAVMRAGEAQRGLLDQFKKMTPEQKELFRIGVAQKMRDAVDNQMTTSTMHARQFDRASIKNLINETFLPESAKTLLDNLSREATMTRTATDVFGNSRTAPMVYGMADLAGDAQIAGAALSGSLRGVLSGLSDKLGRLGGKRKAAEIIRTLSDTDPEGAKSLLDALARKGAQNVARGSSRAKMAARTIGATSSATSTAASPNRKYPALVDALQRAR